MKDLIILCIEKASFSKITLFLSRHTIRKRHKGAAFHFLRFLPTKGPCQKRRVWQIKRGETQPNPKISKISSQSNLTCWQSTRRCSIVTSSLSQRKHLLARDLPYVLFDPRSRPYPNRPPKQKNSTLALVRDSK